MPLKTLGVIAIPDGLDSDFNHAALDPKTRRVFIALVLTKSENTWRTT